MAKRSGFSVVVLSPRSYVTEAFEVLFQMLVDYFYRSLSSKRDDWWEEYVYKKKNSLKLDDELPKRGGKKDLLNSFDELALLKLGENLTDVFSKSDRTFFCKLKACRNKWAHRNKKLTFHWAKYVFSLIIEFSNSKGYYKHEAKLVSLRTKMQMDEFNAHQTLNSRDNLIQFLEDRIFKVADISPNATEELRGIVKRSREMLEKTETSEDVIDFFFNAVINRGYNYKVARACCVTTFEDIRDEFGELCYRKYKG